jgi:hypothetical protein
MPLQHEFKWEQKALEFKIQMDVRTPKKATGGER